MIWLENRGILTPTGGFLADGFTHTINLYAGCAFANSLCGVYCYAQHNRWITKGRKWGYYGAKKNISDAYKRDLLKLRNSGKGVSIYMSSVTDPYIPQEKKLELTRNLLKQMCLLPPDVLVIQTHGTLIERDIEVIGQLAKETEVWVSITVESDMESIPGFPPVPSSPKERIQILKKFKESGVNTQATVSPIMPIKDLGIFVEQLGDAADRIILDHYLLGDGSSGGYITKKTNLERILIESGYVEWTGLDKFWDIYNYCVSTLGTNRVLISSYGFNSVGKKVKNDSPGNKF
jgi:DNA repair photolyase